MIDFNAAKVSRHPMLDHGSLKAAVDVLGIDQQRSHIHLNVIAGKRAQVCLGHARA